MEKIKVYSIAGSDNTRLYFDNEGRVNQMDAKEIEELKEVLDVHEFDTQAEADAFILGIEYAEGWLEAYTLLEEQANEILNA